MRLISYATSLLFLFLSSGFAQTVTTIAGPNININDDIVVDSDGNIYGSDFSNSNNGAIYKVHTDGTVSVFSDGYSSCNGLAFDDDKNLYVVDFTSVSSTHQIYKLNNIGEKTPYGPTIDGASGIIFDPNSDTLYVSQYTNGSNSISKLALDGTVELYCNNSKLNGPVGMAFDDNLNLYIANFNDGEIYLITHDGDSLSLVAEIPSVSYWGVGFLTYASGYLYATGIGKHKIYQVSLDGNVVEFAGTGIPGLKDGQADTAQFHRPNGITTNEAQDTIYISDYVTKSIRMITNLTTGIQHPANEKATKNFRLFQNAPNPFDQYTTVKYEVMEYSRIEIYIISMDGRIVETITPEFQSSGTYNLILNASNWSPGIYYLQMKSNKLTEIIKMNVYK
jgi:sugar lactone lactonase YvrE